MTITTIQERAIEAILALPEQGPRAMCYKLTLLNRNRRGLAAIKRAHDTALTKLGLANMTIAQSWIDVKDMVKLSANASTLCEVLADQSVSEEKSA